MPKGIGWKYGVIPFPNCVVGLGHVSVTVGATVMQIVHESGHASSANGAHGHFADWLLESFNRAAFCLMASVGHRCGLFDAMDGLAPAPASEIAARAGMNERYVREWLGAMVTARVVECTTDGDTERYTLPAGHAALLTRTAGADNLAPLAQYIPCWAASRTTSLIVFETGAGFRTSGSRGSTR
jgi:hypothetical protein